MQITWISCAEQMPPDDMNVILLEPRWMVPFNPIDLNSDFVRHMISVGYYTQWTPYTPEKWKELNKCAD